jgi:hypothetical protein
VQLLLGHQAEQAEGFGRPPGCCGRIRGGVRRTVGGVVGRFRDDQPAAGFEQGSGALGHDGGPAERPGQDPVELPTGVRIPSGCLGAVLADRHPGLEAETPDGVAQEGGPATLGVEEDQGGVGEAAGDDEAGESAPRTEVQEDRRGGAVRPEAAADGDETLGVTEVGVDGAGTEEADGAGLLEDLTEEGELGEGSGGGGVGAGHRRVRTPGR